MKNEKTTKKTTKWYAVDIDHIVHDTVWVEATSAEAAKVAAVKKGAKEYWGENLNADEHKVRRVRRFRNAITGRLS